MVSSLTPLQCGIIMMTHNRKSALFSIYVCSFSQTTATGPSLDSFLPLFSSLCIPTFRDFPISPSFILKAPLVYHKIFPLDFDASDHPLNSLHKTPIPTPFSTINITPKDNFIPLGMKWSLVNIYTNLYVFGSYLRVPQVQFSLRDHASSICQSTYYHYFKRLLPSCLGSGSSAQTVLEWH